MITLQKYTSLEYSQLGRVLGHHVAWRNQVFPSCSHSITRDEKHWIWQQYYSKHRETPRTCVRATPVTDLVDLYDCSIIRLHCKVKLGACCKYKTSWHNREMGDWSSRAMLSSCEISRPWLGLVSDCTLLCLPCPFEGVCLLFFVLASAGFIVDNVVECDVWKYYLWLFPTYVIL